MTPRTSKSVIFSNQKPVLLLALHEPFHCRSHSCPVHDMKWDVLQLRGGREHLTTQLPEVIMRFVLSLIASNPLLPRSIVGVLDLHELTPSVFSIASRTYATSSSTISSLGSLRKDKGNGNEDATPKYNNADGPLGPVVRKPINLIQD